MAHPLRDLLLLFPRFEPPNKMPTFLDLGACLLEGGCGVSGGGEGAGPVVKLLPP